MTSKARELANLGNAFDDGALSNRNLIINGAMQVAQRGTSFTNTNGYQLDRWVVGNPGTNSVSQQFSTTLGMYYMDVTTSAGWGTYQWVENLNARHLKAGDAVTVSYWTNVTSGNFNIATSSTSSVAYSTTTIDTASGWYRRSAVVTISSGQASDIASGGHLRLAIEPAINSFYLTGVQLEAGDTATPFEQRSYGQELALCQRYYQTLVLPARYVGGSSGTNVRFGFTFAEMRASPTCTLNATFANNYAPTGNDLIIWGLGATSRVAPTAASISAYGKKSLTFDLSASLVSAAAYELGASQTESAASILMSAEL